MLMAPMNSLASTNSKMVMNRGAWTAEEDRKLAEYIEVNGAKRWKTVAMKAGLNRCGKSCRLRWLNYLRPNIKRGNISDEEEDLILRLHKLLGNRQGAAIPELSFDVNEFFDFSTEGSYGLEWVNKFLELDEDPWLTEKS
ncbi:hypothetical protein GH714_038030 [Hevea brasiliensis]|uniref:Uncharacterized protein n=1 Tax=Hevea brasiliensis TaxID=3981 RepID=A0A6A6MMQ5_HEVBR|nr:hypothetical protein GH714_038030 [Hevea brasiliensis]